MTVCATPSRSDHTANTRHSVAHLLLLSATVLAVQGCALSVDGNDDDHLGSVSAEVLANNAHHDGFTVTNYVIADEAQLSGGMTGDTSMMCPASLGYACYYKEFLCSGWGVAMQGTGLGHDGKYIHYESGGGPWSSGYVWLENCDSVTFSYVTSVTGRSGRTLIPDYSIAVDPNYIPLGYYVWIDALGRWYRADDTGGAITGLRIDIYTGTNNPGYNFSSGIYLTSTAHAATDPSPYTTKLTTSFGFGAMPTWSTVYDAWWGSLAGWIVTSGGQNGSYLKAWRTSEGSSAKVKVYSITPYQNYTISIYMNGASSTVNYWSELGYRLGNYSAESFDQDPSSWTLVNKFSSAGGYANGNGSVWKLYSKSFYSGANTQISVGFKSGSMGGAGPDARWDTLKIQ